MNELKQCLQNLQTARAEEVDPVFDALLDSRIEQIESRLLEMGEAREQMLACIAKAAAA